MIDENHVTAGDFNATESPPGEEPQQKAEIPLKKSSLLLIVLGSFVLGAVGYSILFVLWLRWLPPPTSAFMIAERWERSDRTEKAPPVRYRWIDWKSISPQVPLAVVAAEDQFFREHHGFDFQAISEAAERNRKSRRLRGASTITQQVAKNLFLWSGKSWLRKGLEAYFTVLLELLWPKKRILEVYVNIAEFGDGVYGVDAAAKTFWGKRPSQLTCEEAALLAAVLPNPKRFKVNRPSPYVLQRQQWIVEQMGQLGGVAYLRDF
ncbi:monofunctional biosynthetic peptidoglycan transglycosylase [candidate division KSB1 bacterium RBG_16_48_16]|nr:MAG: monofunctional biosynthetic peptidoglycan transglycosylase [candidate division KSB1 bacterium RBG_16_48_16]